MSRRSRLLSLVVISFVVLGASQASASTCPTGLNDDNWSNSAGGSWNTGTNWTGGIPSQSSNVCFPDLGKSYTVTLEPANGGGGGTINTLTIGTSTGSDTETLDIVGQSYVGPGNETANGEGLGVASGATINATGTLVLDATAGGTRVLSSDTLGGSAAFGDSPFGGGATVDNYGHIVTESSDYPTWNEQLNANLVNEPGGSITVASGQLQQQTSNTVTNNGTVTTDTGGDYDVTSGGTNDAFINDGTVANNGTFEVGGQTGSFNEHGPVTGNPVLIEAGSTLADQSGAGAFTVEFGTNGLTGTIPAGQTVTVRGASFVTGSNETANYTTLSLGGGSVVNDGKLVLDATSDGSKVLPSDTVGGQAYLYDGTLTNNGTLTFQTDDAGYANVIEAAIVNAHNATTTVSGGLRQDIGVNVTNHGTFTLAPTAVYTLLEGAAFTNSSDGTLVTQIAGATSLGSFALQSPCCAGPGVFTAGGALDPVLLNGYVPSAGTPFALISLQGGQFNGSFAGVGAGFSADYAGESANNPFVGVYYGSAPDAGNSSGGSNGSSGGSNTGSGATVKPLASKPLTRAQKLAHAIVKCEKLKRAKQRAACVKAARKRYAPPKPKKRKKPREAMDSGLRQIWSGFVN